MNQKSSYRNEAIFIDENRKVIKGEKALALIHARRPEHIDSIKGVIKVDADRWQEAQRYERRTWMEGIASMDDRNEDHASCFGNYRALEGREFSSGIELGCGPFTNMRKLLTHCDVREIHLLDPLADDYLDHPFCRYKKRKLGGILKTSLIPWAWRGGLKHPVRFYKHKLDEWKIGAFYGREINLHALCIEDFIPPKIFDLCVMINVIEHCRDAEKIFSRILEMTRPGSYFVFADKVYHAQEEAKLAEFKFDAGHPLHIDHSLLRDFLLTNFNPIWDAEAVETEGSEQYKCNYFIGIRTQSN